MTDSDNIQSHHHKGRDKNNTVNKEITLNSIQLQIVLHYIILTGYYIRKNTFR